MILIKEIIDVCDGKLLSGSSDIEIDCFSKDTRTIKKGDCYLGIKGESFDGNKFYHDAFLKGAKACILDSFDGEVDTEKPIILVDDTVTALQSIASYVRKKLNIKVIGITGSAGKTTTKDMIASVLSTKYKVYKTKGNLNSQIGLPMSILEIKDEEIAVLEMGMNGPGMIRKLTQIAQPDIAVITNIGTAHLGLLGSRENILKAKLEILEGMPKNSFVVINNDNDLLHDLTLEDYQIVTCGIDNPSKFVASNISLGDDNTSFECNNNLITIPMMGNVFVSNALEAIAVGNLCDVSFAKIKEGLESFNVSHNRMEITKLANNITLIDDTYNSNFEALESALKTLVEYPGKKKIAVIGDILELDEFSDVIHTKVGELPIMSELDEIILYGDYSTVYTYKALLKRGFNNVLAFDSFDMLFEYLLTTRKEGDVLLLKASNAMNFKELVDFLKNELPRRTLD